MQLNSDLLAYHHHHTYCYIELSERRVISNEIFEIWFCRSFQFHLLLMIRNENDINIPHLVIMTTLQSCPKIINQKLIWFRFHPCWNSENHLESVGWLFHRRCRVIVLLIRLTACCWPMILRSHRLGIFYSERLLFRGDNKIWNRCCLRNFGALRCGIISTSYSIIKLINFLSALSMKVSLIVYR